MDATIPVVAAVGASVAAFAYARSRAAATRLRRLHATPLGDEARAVLLARVPLYRNLSAMEKARLEGLVQAFLARKTFVGCRGVEVNEVMRVVVAGHACLLYLGEPEPLDPYPELSTVYLYPSTYVRRDEWALDGGAVVREEGAAYDGESWDRASVVLSLRAVRESVREFDGFNVVVHEFAHQYDALDGEANGCPPMPGSLRARWAPAMRAAWNRLVEDDRHGRDTWLDPYGAESPAEFFAVLVEEFLECPHDLGIEHPDLFDLLLELFRFDPRAWHPSPPAARGR